MVSSSTLWLIGAGPMAQAYAAVLQDQNVEFKVIGRGTASAKTFRQATGVPVFVGGLDAALAEFPTPVQAIIAVNVEQLAPVAQRLIHAGCRRLLLEKPAALYLSELEALHFAVQSNGVQLWIAYNRRFHASVVELRKRVKADGGITSAIFEFTEWSHKIRRGYNPPVVKDRWLLANSSHVLDLSFALIGLPADGQWQAWSGGTLDWHPTGARFHGAGITELGIPFSYQADWEAPGRWGVEILTRQYRYILRPLETLQAIPLGSIEPQPVPLDDRLDKQFKPGLYLQCHAFLCDQSQQLCSLSEQLKAFPIYSRIAGYTP